MITLAQKTDIKALRKFALSMSWAFPLMFSLVLPWLFSYALQWWPLIISGVLMMCYALAPSLIYYPYRVWMAIALTLGWINTRVILGAVFYLMILPMGLVLRALNKLQYRPRPRASADSFYQHRQEKLDDKSLENPF